MKDTIKELIYNFSVGKSNKDRQREYRLRKKNDEEWRNKERLRSKINYQKKKATLTPKDVQIRREKNKLSMRRTRSKRKEINRTKQKDTNKNKDHSRKRISKAVASLKRKIKIMDSKITTLQRRNWVLEKRLQKTRQKVNPNVNIREITELQDSPGQRAKHDLQQNGVDPDSASKRLVKRLRVFHCILKSVKESSRTKKDQVASITGSILKKYRAVRYMGKEMGIDRRMLSKGKAKTKRRRLPLLMLNIKEKIQVFLKRDDNSTIIPGKKEEKRVLNDYLSNLHLKFKTENPDIKVSLAVFCRCRPHNVALTSFINRKRCLCIYHQNMALKLKVIYRLANPNPDMIVKQKMDEVIENDMKKNLDNMVSYKIWKRQKMPDGKQKVLCVTETLPKHEFMNQMRHEITKFREHISRVENQYNQSQYLKEKLPPDHVAVHMDFAENYRCTNMEEVQSAYWNKDAISLHPVVIYYRDTVNGNLLHTSLVLLSDDISHNASSVLCIIGKIIPTIKKLVPSVRCINFISDSPVSQYRNRYIMYTVANFESIFGVKCATWTYLETGHGKGPCDGVGGTAKRNADAAVKQNKIIIQNADDFYKWASKETGSKIQYIKYDRSDVEEKRELLKSFNAVPIKNTLSLHAVCSKKKGDVTVRNKSCFCDSCFAAGLMLCGCPGWKTFTIGLRSEPESIIVKEGTVLAILADDPNTPYYLMKAESQEQTLLENETDDWGASYNRGLNVIRGKYYENIRHLSFKLNTKKKAIVPAESILYSSDIHASLKCVLSVDFHESVIQIIQQIKQASEA